ncbi:MAG: SOS response-associated peptidase family protein [Verrucomicrobiae bacterium]|nr:SOS response-associated peptidase family protein [Verrucomicrobiae bacterium]
MCNLYDIGRPRRQRGDEWEAAMKAVLETLPRRHGIRKTDPAPVLKREGGFPCAHVMRWGFEREFNSAVNNARFDRLDGPWSSAWRERRRCLFPITTWYEWHGPAGAKQTFAFESTRGEWLWAAGIWEESKSGLACSMLTRAADPDLAFVHDRMPALISPEHFRPFLEDEDPRGILEDSTLPVRVFRCHNPLDHLARLEGPESIDMLPGF